MKNIIRVKKETGYVVIDKTFLDDKSLSWKAKGIMAYMLSKPDDWTFYLDELMKHSTDGKSSFRSGFKELQNAGYVHRVKHRQEDGTFEWETIVHERPHTDFPQVDNPSMEKPQMDNRTLLNNDPLSNDELSNDKDKPSISKAREIYEHYLSKNIINHNKMTSAMRTNINARLRDYSYEQLIQVIDNYSIIYASDDYWFTHKYGLADLMRDKDVRRFIDDADPLTNHLKDRRSKPVPANDGYDYGF